MASPAAAESLTPQQILAKLLSATVQSRASDLHLRPALPPFFRVEGKLNAANVGPVSASFVAEVIAFTSNRDLDHAGPTAFEYSFEQPGLARFRGHAMRCSEGWALTLRVIPFQIPAFHELRLPPVAKTLSTPGPGLVLITGPTGQGKSTTAAAMLKHLASQETLHLLTIEDPIEYRIQDVPSCVTQREVGRDTPSYAEALKEAMREDPDAMFVGEIRDLESLEVALQAAESGHYVLSTFHTGTALKTILRLVAMFPPADQATARARIADGLRGLISQRLLPRKGTRGRVVACEVLMNNYMIKECIRDPARTSGITAVLERSADQQMRSLDQHLATLVSENQIAADVALSQATSPGDLKRSLGLAGVALGA